MLARKAAKIAFSPASHRDHRLSSCAKTDEIGPDLVNDTRHGVSFGGYKRQHTAGATGKVALFFLTPYFPCGKCGKLRNFSFSQEFSHFPWENRNPGY